MSNVFYTTMSTDALIKELRRAAHGLIVTPDDRGRKVQYREIVRELNTRGYDFPLLPHLSELQEIAMYYE